MGMGSWTSTSWSSYTTTRGYTATSSANELYSRATIKKEFDPKGVEFRESCDSEDHPNSTPIILGLDVTGSMGSMLETVAKRLNVTIEEILDRKPVTDPQIMFAAIGDAECDDFPLQVTQFESDIRIAEQLNDIYFERGGGGNGGESYLLAHYFAARHTKIDSFDKHNKKGFLFTVGDEACLDTLTVHQVKRFLDEDIEKNLTAEEIINEASRKYEIYHLIVKPVAYQPVEKSWRDKLGNNVIMVEDVEKIPEVIVSILELHAGKTTDEVVDSWDGSTKLVVKNAISDLKIANTKEDILVEF